MNYPLYVGEIEFPTPAEAFAYCDEKGYSRTIVHHEPLRLPKKYREKEEE